METTQQTNAGGVTGGGAGSAGDVMTSVPQSAVEGQTEATPAAQDAAGGEQQQATGTTTTSKPLPTEADFNALRSAKDREVAELRTRLDEAEYARQQAEQEKWATLEQQIANADDATQAAFYKQKLETMQAAEAQKQQQVRVMQAQRAQAANLLQEFGLSANDPKMTQVINANLGKQGGMAVIMREAGKLVQQKMNALEAEAKKAEQRGRQQGIASTGVTRSSTASGGGGGGSLAQQIDAERKRIQKTGDTDWSTLRRLQSQLSQSG